MSENTDTTPKGVSFSAREMQTLALAWKCLKSPPQVDLDELARLTGYTRASAQVTFGNIKRKIAILEGVNAEPSTPPKASKATPKSTPKSTGKRTKTVDDVEATPSKRGKKIKKSMDDDDEFERIGKIKKEEVAALVSGANDFMDQADGYPDQQD